MLLKCTVGAPTEAELVASSDYASHALWVRNFLYDTEDFQGSDGYKTFHKRFFLTPQLYAFALRGRQMLECGTYVPYPSNRPVVRYA